MPYSAFTPQPGVNREGTRYTAEGTYYDCNLIRWRKGMPEKMGGWQTFGSGNHFGIARKVHDWGTVAGQNYVGIGTTYKLYVNDGGASYDITPLSQTIELATDPIDTTNGTGLVEIAATSHNAAVGDYVTIAGATATGGIAAGELNVEFRIVAVPDNNTIQVVAASAATSTATGGGSSVTAAFQVNIGLNSYVSGSGWGSGTWGSGTWGGAASLSASGQLRLWSMDNFGDDLVSCIRLGDVFYWDESDGTSTRAVSLSSLPRRTVTLDTDPIDTTSGSTTILVNDPNGHGAGVGDTVTISGSAAIGSATAADINTSHVITATPTDAQFEIDIGVDPATTTSGGGSAVQVAYQAGVYHTPTKAHQVLVSPTARHIIAFGCNEIGSSDIDALMVRWCSSEAAAQWRPTDENSAGFQRIPSGSRFIGALRTRQEILIWTDAGVVSMRYVGVPFIFNFTEVGAGVSMISPNAATAAGGYVFFMDRGSFYAYDGAVRRLPCMVRDYVFQDLDWSQSYKVVAGSNIDYSEVIWFYPSESGDGEIDRYVKYNYDENLWDYGQLSRGCWSNAFTKEFPLASTIRQATLAADPLSVTSGDETLTVTQTAHGLNVGDTVLIQDSSQVGGLDTLVVNTVHTVATVVNDNIFTIELPDQASSTETGGGASVLLVKPDVLYSHESGYSDNGVAFSAFIETGDMDLDDGHQIVFMSDIIPDLAYRGDPDVGSEVKIKVYFRDYPGGARTQEVDETIVPGTTLLHVRGRGRHMAWRIEDEGVETGFGWRVGKFRFNVRPDGRRG